MRIEKVVCATGLPGYIHRDLAAINARGKELRLNAPGESQAHNPPLPYGGSHDGAENKSGSRDAG